MDRQDLRKGYNGRAMDAMDLSVDRRYGGLRQGTLQPTKSSVTDEKTMNQVNALNPPPAILPKDRAMANVVRTKMNKNKYGKIGMGKSYASGAMSAQNMLIQKKLREKKYFDSADYEMEQSGKFSGEPMEIDTLPPPMAMNSPSGLHLRRTSLENAANLSPSTSKVELRMESEDSSMQHPGIPTKATETIPMDEDTDKLSARNLLIQKKLLERKRFDSADYAMKRQGQSPVPTDVSEVPVPPQGKPSISHQVKHIKLSDSEAGKRVPSSMPTAESPSADVQDSRLAARNTIIARKLAERKRFDSGDHFKQQALRARLYKQQRDHGAPNA